MAGGNGLGQSSPGDHTDERRSHQWRSRSRQQGVWCREPVRGRQFGISDIRIFKSDTEPYRADAAIGRPSEEGGNMRRRTFLGGTVAAIVVVTGGLYRFTNLFVKHYPPTPYDDVLALLPDREHAAVLGRNVALFDVSRDGP